MEILFFFFVIIALAGANYISGYGCYSWSHPKESALKFEEFVRYAGDSYLAYLALSHSKDRSDEGIKRWIDEHRTWPDMG